MHSDFPSQHAVERVKAWLLSSNETGAKIARDAGLDEKVIRNVRKGRDWNPTVATLRRIEALMPSGWNGPTKPRRRSA